MMVEIRMVFPHPGIPCSQRNEFNYLMDLVLLTTYRPRLAIEFALYA